MNIAQALALLTQATATAAQLIQQAQVIGQIVAQAQSQGRAELTAEELTQVQQIDNSARQLLVQQITAALQK